MKDSKRIWAWVGLAIVVVAVGAWAIWRFTSNNPPATGPVVNFAPRGQLVPSFPKNLILDTNAAVSGSYSVNYSTSTNQYTAEYDSSSTVTALYKQYTSYLPQNGWTMTGALTTHPNFDVIAASQGSDQLQVVISMQNGGSQVTISYVAE